MEMGIRQQKRVKTPPWNLASPVPLLRVCLLFVLALFLFFTVRFGSAIHASGDAPTAHSFFPRIMQKMLEQGLCDEAVDEIAQQFLNLGYTVEEEFLKGMDDCVDKHALVARFMAFGFNGVQASKLATAVEKIRGPTRTPQPTAPLNDILDHVRATGTDADDVLLRLVGAACGAHFLPAPDSAGKVRFARHEFAHSELNEQPGMQAWLLQQWNSLLRNPPPRVDTKKYNPLWATAAAAGCGKSHFVDELYHTLEHGSSHVLDGTALSGRKVVCLRASFNSNWGFDRTIEESWTIEQQLIARVLCIACERTEWVKFARWFASTSLVHLTLRQLVTEVLPPSLVVLLLDETLSLRGNRTDGQRSTDLYHLVSRLSDQMFRTPAMETRVLSFVTSFHSTYLHQATTAVRRPIQYVQLDRLDPRQVISSDNWEMIYDRMGRPQKGCIDPVALLFDMCMGHPESIATVSRYLSGAKLHPNHQPGAGESFDTYVRAVAGLISIRAASVWEDFARLQYLFPVFLDLTVPGADGDRVPLGAQLALAGFFVNDFKTAHAAQFVPVITAYQLYNFFRKYTEPRQGAIHGLDASVATIRQKMTESQPTQLDPLLPAFFHLRLEAMHAAVEGLARDFDARLELQLCPFEFHHDRIIHPNRIGLIQVSEAHTYRLGLSGLVLVNNCRCHGTCAGFPDASAEQLFSFDDPSFTTFVLAKRGNNFAVDFAIRTWCRRAVQTRHQQSRLCGLTVIGQNQQVQHSYLSAINVRKAIHKLQQVADEYLARRPAESDEVVVLVLVLLCTDAEDIDTAGVVTDSKMHEKFVYNEDNTAHELPAVQYPVAILDRNDVFGLLGSCFTDFFRGRFLASTQAALL